MNLLVGPSQAPDVQPQAPPGRNRKHLFHFLPEFAAVLVTAWSFRSVLIRGRLPGDIGDARWTISLHEHWYRVWTGQEAVRDLNFYYPVPKTLGSSDAFLVQGQIYSVARLLGLDIVDAWVVAGFCFFLLGALGVAALSRRLLDAWWLQVAFVALCVGSYAMQTGFGHVQLFGMLSASWIFVGLHDLISGRLRRAVALLVIVPPLLALSSWYAMVLSAFVIGFLALALALVSTRQGISVMVRQVAGALWRILRSTTGIVLAVLFVGLWTIVLWVYLPSRGLLPAPMWLDVQIYSPRWSDMWNASAGGGGIWSWLYAQLPYQNSLNDQQYGFTPIVYVMFVIASLSALRTAIVRRPWSVSRAPGIGAPGLVAAALTVVAVLALFLMDERGFSFFWLFWQWIPGMDSIRAPYRVMIILFGLIALVILRSFELWSRAHVVSTGGPGRRAVAAGVVAVIVALMFVEMQRPIEARWTRDELLSPALTAQVDQIRAECDAMILTDDATTPVWLTSIDAVILSTESGVPTPQGYSRSDPVGYPDQDAGVDANALVGWLRSEGFAGRACAVSPQGLQVLSDR